MIMGIDPTSSIQPPAGFRLVWADLKLVQGEPWRDSMDEGGV